MPIDLSRRSFLIGTGAALALVAAPKLLVREPVILPDSTNVVRRKLFDVSLGSNGGPPHFSEFTLGHSPDRPAFYFPMARNACFRWTAAPGQEFLLKKEEDLLTLIDWWPPPEEGWVSFSYTDVYDDGSYALMHQGFEFRGLEAITCDPVPMDVKRQYPPGHPKYVPPPPLPDWVFEDDEEDWDA